MNYRDSSRTFISSRTVPFTGANPVKTDQTSRQRPNFRQNSPGGWKGKTPSAHAPLSPKHGLNQLFRRQRLFTKLIQSCSCIGSISHLWCTNIIVRSRSLPSEHATQPVQIPSQTKGHPASLTSAADCSVLQVILNQDLNTRMPKTIRRRYWCELWPNYWARERFFGPNPEDMNGLRS